MRLATKRRNLFAARVDARNDAGGDALLDDHEPSWAVS